MMKILKDLLVPILYITIGWFLNFVTTTFILKKNHELEKKKILREKIEELAKVVYELEEMYKQILAKILVNAETNEKIDSEGLVRKDTLPSLLLSKILIYFYFPELKPEYNLLIKEKDRIGKKILDFLKEDDKVKRKKMAAEILYESDKISKLCDKVIFLSEKIAQKLL